MRHYPLIIAGLSVLTAAGSWSCSSPTGPTGLNVPGVPAFVDCGRFPDSATSDYTLPLEEGRRFRVTRTFDHYLPSNGGVGLYAIDIDMPIGTPVYAMRSGTVVAVEERFSDDDHATYHENWVMIQHTDQTVARYMHLTTRGSLVDVGNSVMQGDLIGRSGNSGASNGPHLHFDVQRCGPNLPPDYNRPPCGQTVPLSFRNTEAQVCGLQAGRSYTVLPIAPAVRLSAIPRG